jgi:hypothetical protein
MQSTYESTLTLLVDDVCVMVVSIPAAATWRYFHPKTGLICAIYDTIIVFKTATQVVEGWGTLRPRAGIYATGWHCVQPLQRFCGEDGSWLDTSSRGR